jgi:hypothetical protein
MFADVVGFLVFLLIAGASAFFQWLKNKGQQDDWSQQQMPRQPGVPPPVSQPRQTSNWEEELHVPIGPENNIEPGGPDRGQPTRLLPRRNRFVFKVRVPADWGDKELVWTLTTKGKTEKAYASLRQDYFIDDYQFRRAEPLPPRIDLKTGSVRVLDPTAFKGKGGKIPGGAATVLELPLDSSKELRSITVRTLANDVVDCLCLTDCATECGDFCAGGAPSDACDNCFIAQCDTEINACLADP